MERHLFLFSPGKWLGEGKIHLNMVEEELLFFTRWKIEEKEEKGRIICTQEIQIKGLSDIMINQFSFFDITSSGFSLDMENYAVGKISGKGFIQEKRIGWEFRVQETGFEGFEFYDKQTDELYFMHGEFSTPDDLRTKIKGKIWRQNQL